MSASFLCAGRNLLLACKHDADGTGAGIAADGGADVGLVDILKIAVLPQSGNFENVGYAREGKLGLYNILIMEEKQTIIALGAGSITKRVFGDGRIERCENVKDVVQYIERIDEMIERKRKLFAENEKTG